MAKDAIATAYVQLTASADGLTDSIGGAVGEAGEKQGSNFGSNFLKTAGSVVQAGASAITGAISKVWDTALSTASTGDEIDKMSKNIGISTDAYQEWAYVMELAGTDVNKLQGGMKTLSGVIADAANGSAGAAAKLEAVGLSIEDLNGLSQEEQLSVVVSALQNMEAGADRTAASTDLLGRSAMEMGSLLDMSADEVENLKNKAHEYGMVMDEEAVQASANFQDSMTTLKNTISGLTNTMMATMLPSFSKIMDGLSDLFAGKEGAEQVISEGVQDMVNAFMPLIPKLTSLIANLAPVLIESAGELIMAIADGMLEALPTIAPTLIDVVVKLGDMFIKNLPKILKVGLEVIKQIILGITKAIPTLIPTIIEVIIEMVNTLLDNLPTIIDAVLDMVIALVDALLTQGLPMIINALPTIIEKLVSAIVGAIPKIIEAIITIVLAIVDNLPTIIKSIVAVLPQIITQVIGGLLECIPQLVEGVIQLVFGIIEHLPEIIVEIVKAIPIIVAGIIKGFIDLFVKFFELGKDIIKKIGEGLKQLGTIIWDAVKHFFNTLKEAFQKFGEKIKEIGSTIINWIVEGFKKVVGKVKDAVMWLVNKIKGWFGAVWDFLFGDKTDYGESAEDAIKAYNLYMQNVADGVIEIDEETYNRLKEARDKAIELLRKTGHTDILEDYGIDVSATQTLNSSADLSNASFEASTSTAMNNLASAIAQNNNVQIVLEGDAGALFRMVRRENNKFAKSNGVSAFA